MIRTTNLARVRLLAGALVLTSVACDAAAQPATSASEAAPTSIALILPSQQTVFAHAAEAVRQGFFAAHAARGKVAVIQVLEVDEDIEQLFSALDGARQRGVSLVVGPLPRSAVNAVIDSGRAATPLVALNFPERDGAAPPSMIALGLSAEAEAQYVVRVAMSEFIGARRNLDSGPRFAVISGSGTLERRVAQAYVAALRSASEPPLVIETAGERPEQWARRLDPARIDAVFLALDAREAALIRARIPRTVLTFGTSLLNLGPLGSVPEATALAHDLDGVRFVDMPWLLRPDVRAGVDLLPPAPLSADLARLFALGVDAYQVAARWNRGETRFTFDGMTGRLALDRAAGPRVERRPAAAIYRNGTIEREEIVR